MRTVAAEVTVANLLDHSAGWYGDEGFDTGSDDDALARYVAERLPQLPQLFPLGAFFSYNNAAFTLLGRLIEVATGTTYNAALEHFLLGPLGLEDTLLDHEAVRQRPTRTGTSPCRSMAPGARGADPALGSSLRRSRGRHLGHDARRAPLRPLPHRCRDGHRSRERRQPGQPAPDAGAGDSRSGTPMQMGRDWFVQDVAGTRVFFHGGDTLGQHTDFFAIPERASSWSC